MSSPPLIIDTSFLEQNTNEDIERQLRRAGGAGFLVYDFRECYNQSDIALQYLEAAFIGQLLYSLDSEVSYLAERTQKHYGFVYKFSFRTRSFDEAGKIFGILRGLLSESDEYACDEPLPEFQDFFDGLGEDFVAFPDLVDSYYANELGSSSEWSNEDREEIYLRHPEWAYHCWLSSESSKCGYSLYVSPRFWMMPVGVDFRTAIRILSDIDEYDGNFEKIETSFIFEGSLCLLSSGITVLIDERFHLQLLEIASVVFPVDYAPGHSGWSRLPAPKYYLISENRDFLICEGDTFAYILFRGDFSLAGTKKMKMLRNSFELYYKRLSHQAGLLLEYECNWNLLDDECFETLCYDLVRRDGRFTPSKVKKMGLANSRDGGRDIIAYTHSRPCTTSKKWLIQCKYSLSKKSLGRSAVQFSELIDEYAADGVIVVTNLLIDGGMHDKAEKIAENRKISIEMWDGLEIERLVNQHIDLFKRYFNSNKSK